MSGLMRRSVIDGQAQLEAHVAAFTVVADAHATDGVADGAVLEAVGFGELLQGQALLAQPVLDLIGSGLRSGLAHGFLRRVIRCVFLRGAVVGCDYE